MIKAFLEWWRWNKLRREYSRKVKRANKWWTG
jgi:hypothetical protein